MTKYIEKIWGCRYFWWFLVLADLRVKFRRSTMGIGWAFFQPVLMTALLSFVMGNIFKQGSTSEYIIFVFSGIILWEYIIQAVVAGSNSVINAEAYIKQFKHPLAIYALKSTLVNIIVFGIGFIALVIWLVFFKPSHLMVCLIALPIAFLFLFLFGWCLSIICGFINVKFRDFQQLMIIFFQAIYFMTPVFIDPKIFRDSNLVFLVDYNPFAHLLNLVRTPLMQGNFPSMVDYAWCGGFIIILAIVAVKKISKEDNLIFYV